jgi:hypothetical protein
MRNLLYIFLLSIFSMGTTLAQSGGLTVTPGLTITVTGNASDSDVVGEATVVNNTGQSISLVWERQTNSLSNGWNSLVCDNVTCWGPNKNANTLTVDAGASSIMNVHFKPNGNPGNGTVVLHVYSQADPTTAVDITYTTQVNATSISTNAISQMRFYPIPASSNLNITFGNNSQARYVELYTVVGEKIEEYYIPSGQNSCGLNIECLNAGMYFVRILNDRRMLIASKAFPKVN